MAGPRTLKRTHRAVNAYRDLRRAVAKLTVLHEKQLRGFQLTATQYDLLEALLYAGPATLTEIAERILCTQQQQALSRLCQKLVEGDAMRFVLEITRPDGF